jgi:hypothetical protein
MQQEHFFAEATRVLKPGGVLAVWCYEVFETTPPIDAVVSRLYHDTIGPYWPPERRMIERGYADVVMPHEALAPPTLTMSLDWALDALVGYLGTWSAVQRYRADRGDRSAPSDARGPRGGVGRPGGAAAGDVAAEGPRVATAARVTAAQRYPSTRAEGL